MREQRPTISYITIGRSSLSASAAAPWQMRTVPASSCCLSSRRVLRARAELTLHFGGSAEWLAARRVERRVPVGTGATRNAADGRSPPRPGGLRPFCSLAALLRWSLTACPTPSVCFVQVDAVVVIRGEIPQMRRIKHVQSPPTHQTTLPCRLYFGSSLQPTIEKPQ